MKNKRTERPKPKLTGIQIDSKVDAIKDDLDAQFDNMREDDMEAVANEIVDYLQLHYHARPGR